MLSDLIATEPDTLSIQESLLNKNLGLWKSDVEMTGSAYWSFLSTPSLQWKTAVRLGASAAEIRYPANGQWAGNRAAIPPIALITLPAISADPDSLLDLLAARVPDFPAQVLTRHHLMFLDLLASLQQRRRWVERSGGSSALADPLLARFPFDKVVYLTRDLADTALSMSRQVDFQFGVIRSELFFQCGFDPYNEFTPLLAPDSGLRVPADLQCLLPEQMTVETLTERGGKVAQHKLVWLGMSRAAEVALAKHPPPRLLRMSYEDLVAAPEEQLTRFAQFLGFTDAAGWAARSAGQVGRARQPVSSVKHAAHTPPGLGGSGLGGCG